MPYTSRENSDRVLLHQRLVAARANPQEPQSFVFLDLDHFTAAEALLGPAGADLLVDEAYRVICAHAGKRATPAWLGGDKFGVLLEGTDVAAARALACEIVQALRLQRVGSGTRHVPLSACAGVASLAEDGEDLLRVAALACELAHEDGVGRVWVSGGTRRRRVRARHEQKARLAELYDAFESDALWLFAQRIVSLTDQDQGKLHYEILLRVHDGDALRPPSPYVAVAERYRLAPYLDRWIVSRALGALAQDLRLNPQRVSINLSGQTVSDPLFLRFLTHEFARHGITFGRACFEITETAAIRNWPAVSRFAAFVRRRGAAFKLDDFGTGLSSFTYLKRMQVDYVKIDGRFVRNLLRSEEDRAIVEALHHVAQSFGLQTVAEYVEDDATAEALREIGVQWAQGYAFHRPELWCRGKTRASGETAYRKGIERE